MNFPLIAEQRRELIFLQQLFLLRGLEEISEDMAFDLIVKR